MILEGMLSYGLGKTIDRPERHDLFIFRITSGSAMA